MNIKQTINTEYIKLDQLLKLVGVTQTGGQAKELIQSGSIKVNGQICTVRGRKVRAGDVIDVGAQIIEVISDH